MINPYDDLINLQHHTSSSRPQMSAHDRAAQFSPFAALAGYDSAITEMARLTDSRVELDEYSKADLDERLSIIQEQIDKQPEVSITFFLPDHKKSGGVYISVTGCVKKIDEHERILIMRDATRIPIDDIFEIEIGCCEYEKY
jgi:hypothetical protein